MISSLLQEGRQRVDGGPGRVATYTNYLRNYFDVATQADLGMPPSPPAGWNTLTACIMWTNEGYVFELFASYRTGRASLVVHLDGSRVRIPIRLGQPHRNRTEVATALYRMTEAVGQEAAHDD